MAAILTSAPGSARSSHLGRAPVRRTPSGTGPPALLLIDGGRSAERQAVLRRRRAVAALLLVAVGLLGLLGGRAALRALVGPSAAPGSSHPPAGETIRVEVHPGDSLWSLTRRAQPQGDIRPVVDALSAARSGAPLHAGEQIAIPVG